MGAKSSAGRPVGRTNIEYFSWLSNLLLRTDGSSGRLNMSDTGERYRPQGLCGDARALPNASDMLSQPTILHEWTHSGNIVEIFRIQQSILAPFFLLDRVQWRKTKYRFERLLSRNIFLPYMDVFVVVRKLVTRDRQAFDK